MAIYKLNTPVLRHSMLNDRPKKPPHFMMNTQGVSRFHLVVSLVGKIIILHNGRRPTCHSNTVESQMFNKVNYVIHFPYDI